MSSEIDGITDLETEAGHRQQLYQRGQYLITQLGVVDVKHEFQFNNLCEHIGGEDLEAYVFALAFDKLSPSVSLASAQDDQAGRPTDDDDLSNLLERYLSVRAKKVQRGSVMSDDDKCGLFLRFLETRHPDKTVRASHVTADAVRAYCDFLDIARKKISVKTPLSFADLSGSHGNPMSPKTRFSHGQSIAAFIEWLAANKYCVSADLAPIVRQHHPKPKNPAALSKGFTDGEVQALLTSEAYRTGEFKRASDYWVPLLGAYTGARAAEILQLMSGDIQQRDKVWLIAISDGEGSKQLKTASARREVPIHPSLLDLGFLEFVSEVGVLSSARLFPEEERCEKGYYQAFSKRFNRLRETLGIHSGADKIRNFHSFRHTFNWKLKQLQVPDYIINMLMGHSLVNKGMSFSTYGKEALPIEDFFQIVSRIDYGIDPTIIKPWSLVRERLAIQPSQLLGATG